MTNNESSDILKRVLWYGAVLTAVCLVSGAALATLYTATRDLIALNRVKAFMTTLETAMGGVEDLQVVVPWPRQRPVPEGAEVVGAAGEAARYVQLNRETFRDRFQQINVAEALFIGSTDGGARYVARGSEPGYQSEVVVLVAVDAEPRQPVAEDPVIYRMAVVSSEETPGLGENIKSVEKDVSLWAALTRVFTGGGLPAQEKRPWFQGQFSGKRLSDLVVQKRADTEMIRPITGATITSKAATAAARQAAQRIIETTAALYGEAGSTPGTQ
jgi:Na+-translocating ferredoxin:NAD+ oxidoreductase RnfG subunit